jgi:hypothetical protein
MYPSLEKYNHNVNSGLYGRSPSNGGWQLTTPNLPIGAQNTPVGVGYTRNYNHGIVGNLQMNPMVQPYLLRAHEDDSQLLVQEGYAMFIHHDPKVHASERGHKDYHLNKINAFSIPMLNRLLKKIAYKSTQNSGKRTYAAMLENTLGDISSPQAFVDRFTFVGFIDMIHPKALDHEPTTNITYAKERICPDLWGNLKVGSRVGVILKKVKSDPNTDPEGLKDHFQLVPWSGLHIQQPYCSGDLEDYNSLCYEEYKELRTTPVKCCTETDPDKGLYEDLLVPDMSGQKKLSTTIKVVEEGVYIHFGVVRAAPYKPAPEVLRRKAMTNESDYNKLMNTHYCTLVVNLDSRF